ncbi:MAG: ATP-binding protein [Burkholderiales bacterium]
MTLRARFNLLSILILFIPVAGWLIVDTTTGYLFDNQLQNLEQRTKSIAETLSSLSSTIFEDKNEPQPVFIQTSDLTKVPIIRNMPPTIDGDLSEWREFKLQEEALTSEPSWPESKTFSGAYRIGRYENRIYIGVQVRSASNRQFSDGSQGANVEQVYLSTINQYGTFKQYLIRPQKNGQVTIKVRNEDQQWEQALYREIRGEVRQLNLVNNIGEPLSQAYELELAIGRHLIGSAMCLVVFKPGEPNRLQSCQNHLDKNALKPVQINSPNIEAIVDSFRTANSRLIVVNRDSVVQQQNDNYGSENNTEETNSSRTIPPSDNSVSRKVASFLGFWPEQILHEFEPWIIRSGKLENIQVADALAKGKGSLSTKKTDGITRFVTAVEPIFIDGQIKGAVLIQESTDEVFAVRYQFIKGLTLGTILFIFLYLPIHFLFLGKITKRLKLLAKITNDSIDGNGRVVKTITPDKTKDEIGEVSQNLAEISGRLKNYTNYLENSARRLSHELRTPLAGLQSSIDLIKRSDNFEEAGPYINRAEAGIERLNRIITNMSEASDLEASFQNERLEPIDLSQLIILSIEDYREIYRQREFEVIVTEKQIMVDGSADSLRQMLDKIIDNANDFGIRQTSIVISLNVIANNVILQIMNSGPTIPDEKREQIFDSLVSDRSDAVGRSSHLGLGLYVARLICEFHKGNISVRNRSDGGGVTFEISLPRSQSEQH